MVGVELCDFEPFLIAFYKSYTHWILFFVLLVGSVEVLVDCMESDSK